MAFNLKKYGPDIANYGLNLLNKKTRQSMAGSMLKSGKVPSMAGSLGGKAVTKMLGKANIYLAAIQIGMQAAAKSLKILAKTSPALQQQMIIMRKSISLFLRPIGDIMAKFMRPMAIAMIKFSMAWNRLFGTSTRDNVSVSAKEDVIKQLETQKEVALSTGDVAKAEALQKEIDAIRMSMLSLNGTIDDTAKIQKTIAEELYKEGQNNKDAWIDANGNIIAGSGLIFNAFSNIQSGVQNWIAGLTKKASSNFNLVTGTSSGMVLSSLGLKGLATGGEIQTSGAYNLHAGERVTNAGDNSRSSQSSTTISNTYHVQATINNEMDVRDLARQLASLQETELRRRGSYI